LASERRTGFWEADIVLQIFSTVEADGAELRASSAKVPFARKCHLQGDFQIKFQSVDTQKAPSNPEKGDGTFLGR
jgi:hypothetical protein